MSRAGHAVIVSWSLAVIAALVIVWAGARLIGV